MMRKFSTKYAHLMKIKRANQLDWDGLNGKQNCLEKFHGEAVSEICYNKYSKKSIRLQLLQK